MARITGSARRVVYNRAKERCEYCQTQQINVISMMVDHIIPQVAGGSDDFDNLCLACPTCNGAKHNFQTGTDPETGEDVPLYHPRNDDWTSHFAWSEDFTEIIGLSPVGRATVLRLNMNLQEVVEARRRWVSVGWHPPSD